MRNVLGRFGGVFYALMRVVTGLLFACHGVQKMFGVFGMPHPVPLASQLGLASVIELVGGLLIAFGLFTSVAAFIAAAEMAWAYLQAHAPANPWPIVNRGELAVLYCFVFLYIASQGSGPYSLDRLLGRKV